MKEEGTVRWIRSSVRVGDVFYDIGANIGLYSLVAGKRVGEDGNVYAFEPHVANAYSLLRNVHDNGLGDRVVVLSCALSNATGFVDFNYRDWTAGSAMSQLGDARDDEEQAFAPVAAECKFAVAVDELVAKGVLRSPDHVKIDVDGNELRVLGGMRAILGGASPPISVQVEINRRQGRAIDAFMNEFDFTATERHDTQFGKARIAAGADPEAVAHNVIFRPATPSRHASARVG